MARPPRFSEPHRDTWCWSGRRRSDGEALNDFCGLWDMGGCPSVAWFAQYRLQLKDAGHWPFLRPCDHWCRMINSESTKAQSASVMSPREALFIYQLGGPGVRSLVPIDSLLENKGSKMQEERSALSGDRDSQEARSPHPPANLRGVTSVPQTRCSTLNRANT